MALTYIKGDKVDQWVKRIAEWWDTLDVTVLLLHKDSVRFVTIKGTWCKVERQKRGVATQA